MKIRPLLYTLFFFFFSSNVYGQAPVNDDPCNATPLTAGTGCNYVTGTTTNATATVGVPAPGCANYTGGDVWFSVTVPASGSLIFDSNTGIITDGQIRRFNGMNNNLQDLSVKKVMTKKPVSINLDTLAEKALSIMNAKKITSLCVHKDKNKKKTVGILHIHNILQSNIH